MKILPNKTILAGRVNNVKREPDGWGATVEFAVERSVPANGYQDFIGAKPGSVIKIFAAEPDAIRPGGRYELTASVLGGPGGERVVAEDVKSKAD